MRGTGEGSRPYDLRPNSTMTNATVDQSVEDNDGHSLTVKYKDGEKKVEVLPDTPVVTFVPGDKSDLKAGAKVIALHEATAGRFVRNQPRQRRPRRPDAADVKCFRRKSRNPWPNLGLGASRSRHPGKGSRSWGLPSILMPFQHTISRGTFIPKLVSSLHAARACGCRWPPRSVLATARVGRRRRATRPHRQRHRKPSRSRAADGEIAQRVPT